MAHMLLSELFGDDSHKISEEELNFFMTTQSLWRNKFDAIVRESAEPKVKTRIHVRKKRKNG